jgi:hypothetical protein
MYTENQATAASVLFDHLDEDIGHFSERVRAHGGHVVVLGDFNARIGNWLALRVNSMRTATARRWSR